MMIPAFLVTQCMPVALADKAAQALTLLGADQDLFNSAVCDALLDLINKYLDDNGGIAPPFNPACLCMTPS